MPSFVLWFTTILFVGILLFAAIKVEFRQLLNNKPGQHVYFGDVYINMASTRIPVYIQITVYSL